MCIVICTLLLSRPARGAWVEILILIDEIGVLHCRAPQGARGLKSYWFWLFPSNFCRAPQGARGLKYFLWESGSPLSQSRPARGAWVEIKQGKDYDFTTLVAPRTGRVG